MIGKGIFFAMSFSVVAIFTVSQVKASTSWQIQTVESKEAVSEYTSIAVDSSEHVHISYGVHRDWDMAMKYATNASGSWVRQTIESGSAWLLGTSIAVDSSSHVHISYYDNTNDILKYATNASGSWIIQTVDSYGANKTSVAVDSSDYIHISYCDYDGLKYATNASGSWVVQTLVSGYQVWNTSIAVDSSDHLHISYSQSFPPSLKYATNASGPWVIQTVDSYGGFENSVAVDSSDYVHISYHDYDYDDLKYATNTSGPWVIQTVDSGGYIVRDNSIVVDSSDHIHIGYHDYDNEELKYATNASGSWVRQTVDTEVMPEGDPGGRISIAVDSSDHLHISYSNDALIDDLKYAVSTVPLELISPNGGEVIPSGSNYTIEWDAPLEMVSFKLKYSMNNGTSWSTIESGITDTSHNWIVPTPPKNKKMCLVKVIGYDDSGTKVGADRSDSTFTIEGVKVTSPNGGEILTGGGLYTITWQTSVTKNPVETVKLKYTKNGGEKWLPVYTLTGGDPGTYDWTVPDVPKTKDKCMVKVLLKDAAGKTVGTDTSDGHFTIEPATP